MSDIILDRVTLGATGDLTVAASVRSPAEEPAPSRAGIRLAARDTDESQTFPAQVSVAGSEGGAAVWSIDCTIPDGAVDAFSPGADILDCFIEVAFDREVVVSRLRWGDAQQMWLPYPTLRRKLSLTQVRA